MTEQFLEALAARDFERLKATFTSDARARFLLPRGLEEYTDSDAIVRRIESWFGAASEFDLEASSGYAIGPLKQLTYRFSLVRDGSTREVVEQAVFLGGSATGIERIDLVCSGFHRAPHDVENATYVFDAGAMGCGDGLAEEFRRQLMAVPVGESIQVVVRDPAAKEDLPALARMLGQSVKSVEAHDDGRLAIHVERVR